MKLKDVLMEHQLINLLAKFVTQLPGVNITIEILGNMTAIPSDQEGTTFAAYYGGDILMVTEFNGGYIVSIQ